jgi:uncharacterized membrane protein YeiH
MDLIYIFGLLATAAFAASGVLAALGKRIDLFGAVVVAVVTAVGGGTLRDLILNVPVFWLYDEAWLMVAVIAGSLAFFVRSRLDRHVNALAYLDAMGVALVAAGALQKCIELGLPGLHGVALGVITGVGGGLIRDTLTSRDTLLVSPDLYATPIIFGLTCQYLLQRSLGMQSFTALLLGGAIIFIFRALAIRFALRMPSKLVNNPRD